jgi:hypothetical protein
LNDAIKSDAKFAPAYYELFYYNFFRPKFPEAEAQLANYIANSDPDIQHEYLYAQLCWARKDFPCAITKAESVVASTGDKTKPKVYKLLGDAFYQKGGITRAKGDSVDAAPDYTSAKNYMNKYFSKEKSEDLISNDYKLWADILDRTDGIVDEIFNTYVKGAPLDSVISSRIDFLKQGAAYFKTARIRDKEGDIIEMILAIKPKPAINDYFDLTLARYFSNDYTRSRATAFTMVEKYPDQVFGYECAFNNSRIVDTVRKDSIAVPDALKLFEFANKDTSKFKKLYISSASFLAIYYANDVKDKEKAIEYLEKWKMMDVVNAGKIQQNIDILKKAPATKAPARRTGKLATPASKTPVAKTDKKYNTTTKNYTVVNYFINPLKKLMTVPNSCACAYAI